MKGIICAGGKGTRLYPLTKVVNKHLLPVYNKPMVFYPLYTLLENGVKDIIIVCNEESIEQFVKVLGHGGELDCKIQYKVQNNSLGISDAIHQAKSEFEGHKIAVILGDNIFFDRVNFSKDFSSGCELFLKEVHDPERFGVATVVNDKITKIVEKPEYPESNLAVTGLYLFDENIFKFIETIKPSKRGELEVTDLCNIYVNAGQAKPNFLESSWLDAGTFESLHKANSMARDIFLMNEREHGKIEKVDSKIDIGIAE